MYTMYIKEFRKQRCSFDADSVVWWGFNLNNTERQNLQVTPSPPTPPIPTTLASHFCLLHTPEKIQKKCPSPV